MKKFPHLQVGDKATARDANSINQELVNLVEAEGLIPADYDANADDPNTSQVNEAIELKIDRKTADLRPILVSIPPASELPNETWDFREQIKGALENNLLTPLGNYNFNPMQDGDGTTEAKITNFPPEEPLASYFNNPHSAEGNHMRDVSISVERLENGCWEFIWKSYGNTGNIFEARTSTRLDWLNNNPTAPLVWTTSFDTRSNTITGLFTPNPTYVSNLYGGSYPKQSGNVVSWTPDFSLVADIPPGTVIGTISGVSLPPVLIGFFVFTADGTPAKLTLSTNGNLNFQGGTPTLATGYIGTITYIVD